MWEYKCVFVQRLIHSLVLIVSFILPKLLCCTDVFLRRNQSSKWKCQRLKKVSWQGSQETAKSLLWSFLHKRETKTCLWSESVLICRQLSGFIPVWLHVRYYGLVYIMIYYYVFNWPAWFYTHACEKEEETFAALVNAGSVFCGKQSADC